MPRSPRTTAPGVLQHVISRFVDRRWYLSSDRERRTYLELLSRALSRSDWRCIAYCLMSNHLHFAMVAGERSLDSWVRRVNSPFAQWLNAEHNRLGPVFADRPAVYQVAPGREAHVVAYIHNNPVRAGVVANARDSTWSSHAAYLGLAPRPPWLHVDEGLVRTGCAADPIAFDHLVDEYAGSSIDEPNVAAARTEARRVGPFEIGTATLSESVEFPIVCRPFVRKPVPVPRLVEAVCACIGIPSTAIPRRHARGSASEAKRVAIHVAVELGMSISNVATALNVSRQRGSKIAGTSLCDAELAMVRRIVRALGES